MLLDGINVKESTYMRYKQLIDKHIAPSLKVAVRGDKVNTFFMM